MLFRFSIVRQAREGPRPLYERLGLVQDEHVEESDSEARTPSKKEKASATSVVATPTLASGSTTGLGQE
jgi:hypothetical protein